MARVCYLLMVHKSVPDIITQAQNLRRTGAFVVIHFDKRAPRNAHTTLKAALANDSGIAFAPPRRCNWGDWTLVDASLRLLRTGLTQFPDATHFYLISGDCAPIQSYRAICEALSRPTDYIECAEFYRSHWIKLGLHKERVHHYNFINERKYKRAFYYLHEAQSRLSIHRQVPANLALSIGAQWWCLRRSTAETLLDFLDQRPEIERFFRWVWIPDECFFQTLVATLIPGTEISGHPPTFFNFTDYGVPMIFYDDHAEFLRDQTHFFARKIAPHAKTLKSDLYTLYASDTPLKPRLSGGHKELAALAKTGRHNGRHAPRIWDPARLFIETPEAGTPARRLGGIAVIAEDGDIADSAADTLAQHFQTENIGRIFEADTLRINALNLYRETLYKRERNFPAFIDMLCRVTGAPLVFTARTSDHILLGKLLEAGMDLRLLHISALPDGAETSHIGALINNRTFGALAETRAEIAQATLIQDSASILNLQCPQNRVHAGDDIGDLHASIQTALEHHAPVFNFDTIQQRTL